MVESRPVIRLRSTQLGVLARANAGDDITPFVTQALEHHPQIAAELGRGLSAHVTKLRELAFEVGLWRPADIHRFVDLGLVMGLEWLHAQRGTIIARLGDPHISDVSARLDALLEHVLLSLEAPT